MTIAKLIAFGYEIEKAKIGYDQNQRWSFLDIKNKTIKPGKDGDCSAIGMGLAFLAGLIDLKTIQGPCWTGNLDVLVKRNGWKVYKYTNLKAVKPGDMVLAKNHHVVTVLSNKEWLSAEKNEQSRSSGGKDGDQTGREVVIRAPYERSGGWDYILRPPADAVSGAPTGVVNTKNEINADQLSKALISVGSSGVRSSVQIKKDGTRVKTSLVEITELLNKAFVGRNYNKYAMSIFVATMLQESAWLMTTVEYGSLTKRYDPYRGRTFEQLTHESNYLGFGKWCKSQGLVDSEDIFVRKAWRSCLVLAWWNLVF